MKKVSFLTVFILLSGICQVNAQAIQATKPYWGIYGVLALPRGDFGSNDYEDDEAGFAQTGFGVGIEHTYPLNSPEISWISSVSFILNGVDYGEVNNMAKEMFNSQNVNVDVGDWINIPVMTGIKYQSIGSSNMCFYGTIQVGLNFINSPKVEMDGSYLGNHFTATAPSDFASSIGYSIGGGIILNEKFNIGLQYLILGEPDVETIVEVNVKGERYKEEIKAEQTVSLLLLTFGIKF